MAIAAPPTPSPPIRTIAVAATGAAPGPVILVLFAGLLLLGTVLSATPLHAEPRPALKPYQLGVFPFLPPTRLERAFAPIAVEMSKLLGRPVEFRTTSTFERFSENLAAKQYDFAFVQPFMYIAAADKYGYAPLVAWRKPLTAIFVVRKDSPYRDLQQLAGKRVALPPRDAAVSHLALEYLAERGLDRRTDYSYYRSHFSCLQKVLVGEADACVSAEAALDFFESHMKLRMSVIAETRGIPHSLYVAQQRVPQADRKAVQQFLLSRAPDERQAERSGLRHQSFVAVTDSDYDVVRRIESRIQAHRGAR